MAPGAPLWFLFPFPAPAAPYIHFFMLIFVYTHMYTVDICQQHQMMQILSLRHLFLPLSLKNTWCSGNPKDHFDGRCAYRIWCYGWHIELHYQNGQSHSGLPHGIKTPSVILMAIFCTKMQTAKFSFLSGKQTMSLKEFWLSRITLHKKERFQPQLVRSPSFSWRVGVIEMGP